MENKEHLISVIVPVYQVENTLKKCVDSILNQTYKNLEIILVDDGSPDGSGKICDEYALLDSRIKVIHKKNGGLSSARNAGLDVAIGEYVGFVDSDDWIEPTMYEELYKLLIDNCVKLANSGVFMDYDDGRTVFFDVQYSGKEEIVLMEKEEALKENLLNTRITNSVCNKLFHTSIFDNLRMKEGIYFEDMEVMPKCIEKAEKVVHYNKPMYHYVQSGESILRRKYDLKHFTEVDLAFERMTDYKSNYPKLFIQAVAAYISISLNVIHKSRGVKACVKRRHELIKEIKRKQPKDVVECMRKNDRLKYKVFRVSPMLYEFIMIIYDRLKTKK